MNRYRKRKRAPFGFDRGLMRGEGFVILLSAIHFPSFCFFATQESTLKNGNSNLLKSNGMLVKGKGRRRTNGVWLAALTCAAAQ